MVYFFGKGLTLEKSTITNTSKLSSLAFLVVSLSASAAFAENPVAPIPQHAPQNISQINGQLVEVGNHNKYDYSYKKFNIGTNPFGVGLDTDTAFTARAAFEIHYSSTKS